MAFTEVAMALAEKCEASVFMEQEHETRVRGRLRVCIPEEQLVYLIEHAFPLTKIADTFGCCTRTVSRRIIQLGLQNSYTFADIDDNSG